MKLTSKQVSDALLAINSDYSFVIEGGKIVTWYSNDPIPTEEEIVQKVAELEYQEEVEVYKEQRAREYPSYADQFDQIFHEGVDAWKRTILDIKKKYPKQVMQPEVLDERKRQALADLEASREEQT